MKSFSRFKVLLRLEFLLPISYLILYIPLSQLNFGGWAVEFSQDFPLTVIGFIPLSLLLFIPSFFLSQVSGINISLSEELFKYLQLHSSIDPTELRFIPALFGYMLYGLFMRKALHIQATKRTLMKCLKVLTHLALSITLLVFFYTLFQTIYVYALEQNFTQQCESIEKKYISSKGITFPDQEHNSQQIKKIYEHCSTVRTNIKAIALISSGLIYFMYMLSNKKKGLPHLYYK